MTAIANGKAVNTWPTMKESPKIVENQCGSRDITQSNEAKVTFAAPGTYKFACLVHPVMRGTVVVQ